MLKVSFCGDAISRHHLPCGHSRGHISCSIDLKIGQNVRLDET